MNDQTQQPSTTDGAEQKSDTPSPQNEPASSNTPANLPPPIPGLEPATEQQTPPQNVEVVTAEKPETQPEQPATPKRDKRELSPKFKAFILRQEKRELEEAPRDGIVPVNETLSLKPPKDLMGITKRKWGAQAKKAIKQFGPLLNAPTIAKVALVSGMDTLEQVDEAIAFCNNLLQGRRYSPQIGDKPGAWENIDISNEDRIKAVAVIAEAGKIRMDMAKTAVHLAEAANGGKTTADEKPKNAPPSMGFEVTTSDGSRVAGVAKMG